MSPCRLCIACLLCVTPAVQFELVLWVCPIVMSSRGCDQLVMAVQTGGMKLVLPTSWLVAILATAVMHIFFDMLTQVLG